ncbi:MAG: hypothetical protein IPH18_06695 [Chitinophagaceae bacterium]|nr:hypothetical protein [Chitinophagaceae bacterium]MBK8951142.1 hypothetical protein [Chitinophagaceae bacterium]
MGPQLTLSLLEIIVLMLGAITLGVTIHFFVTSRKSLKEVKDEMSGKTGKELNEWKSKYFNATERRDAELLSFKKQIEELKENNNILEIEADETRKLNRKLKEQLDLLPSAIPANTATVPNYMDQLKMAQSSLLEHNEKINQLLGQIDLVKETEEKKKEILRYNEELNKQVNELRFKLSQKEKEISGIRQKENLTKEMSSMLDNAYSEFSVLQEKMQRLESQISVSKRINIEFEDLKESHYRISLDYEELKRKNNNLGNEYQDLKEILFETEDKLKEANFQRQQLQKRVTYLEELSKDMQDMAETNKSLENQLKRIGELESQLDLLSEEKNHLAQPPIKEDRS